MYKRWIPTEKITRAKLYDLYSRENITIRSIDEKGGYWYLRLECPKVAICRFDEALKIYYKVKPLNRRPKSVPPPGDTKRKRGRNFETTIASILTGEGFTSKKIPLSGALEGDTGDITFLINGAEHTVETKMTTKEKWISLNADVLTLLQEGKTDVIIFRQGKPTRLFATIPLSGNNRLTFLDYLKLKRGEINEKME
ncbi:MAG: hypothetical protein HXS54_06255 [Theionarchaea archaeon]|nr:hypothetical protein [Theionarchaea archaeon]DBA34861.1 TPA_asm: hypothetical protein vir521_00067 [Caudoviricetes sp. vir521]